jgi:hypothetical protein
MRSDAADGQCTRLCYLHCCNAYYTAITVHTTHTSPPDDTTATEDEEALKKEMLLLPNNVGLRRINDMMKRAKLVKVSNTLSMAVRHRASNMSIRFKVWLQAIRAICVPLHGDTL